MVSIPLSIFTSIVALYFMGETLNTMTLCGLALYASAAFLYLIALRKIPVSVAFPSVSLSYAIVAVLGHFLFGEPFGIKQIGGIALIMGGVVLINQG
jgi:drug/metabolite transporter (DMT)-like permease